jgi:hypothetical protein
MTISQSDIEDAGKAPKRVTTDEGTVEERSVSELIKADQYAKANQAGDNPLHGLRVSRFKPGGAV